MASNDVCGLCGAPGTALDHGTLGCAKRLRAEVAALRERLSVVERERDAEAKAALNHAECAERSLRSACDARDALDIVAAALGVDTSTDAETEARACVSVVAALREEVERLRKEAIGRGCRDKTCRGCSPLASEIKPLIRKHVEDTLAAHNGNKTRAAKALGIDRRTLYRMLARWEK